MDPLGYTNQHFGSIFNAPPQRCQAPSRIWMMPSMAWQRWGWGEGILDICGKLTLKIGGFNFCYFHPENWGRWTHFDSCFFWIVEPFFTSFWPFRYLFSWCFLCFFSRILLSICVTFSGVVFWTQMEGLKISCLFFSKTLGDRRCYPPSSIAETRSSF